MTTPSYRLNVGCPLRSDSVLVSPRAFRLWKKGPDVKVAIRLFERRGFFKKFRPGVFYA